MCFMIYCWLNCFAIAISSFFEDKILQSLSFRLNLLTGYNIIWSYFIKGWKNVKGFGVVRDREKITILTNLFLPDFDLTLQKFEKNLKVMTVCVDSVPIETPYGDQH